MVSLLVKPPAHGLPLHVRHLLDVADAAVAHQHMQHKQFYIRSAASFLVGVLKQLAAPTAQKVLPARALYAFSHYLHNAPRGSIENVQKER